MFLKFPFNSDDLHRWKKISATEEKCYFLSYNTYSDFSFQKRTLRFQIHMAAWKGSWVITLHFDRITGLFPPSILSKILLLPLLLLLKLAPWKKWIPCKKNPKATMINLPRHYNIRPKDKHGTMCLTFLKD